MRKRVRANPREASFGSYLRAWRQRMIREARSLEARRRLALCEAKQLARYLAKRYAIPQAAVVGSVLRAGEFGPDSDVDLIVWGLPRRSLIRAWVEVEKRVSFPVDLIAWESATPRLRRTFFREGRVIFRSGAN